MVNIFHKTIKISIIFSEKSAQNKTTTTMILLLIQTERKC